MKRIIYILILVVGLITSLNPLAAHAVEPLQALAVSPPTFELSANPGDTIKHSTRVDNLTSEPLKITVDRKNFTALGEEGQVGLTDEDSSFSLASWISVDPTEVEIPAKSSKVFDFTIKVPTNAEPGGRFGSLVFKTVPRPFKGGTGVAVGQEIGTLILLRIAGNVTEHASIEEFKSTKHFKEYGPIDFDTRVKNTGNVHVKPTGSITVTDFFGRKVATIPVESKNVLPGAVRRVESSWNKKHLFGKYTATLSLQYGSSSHMLTSSTTFTVLPYRIMLIWLLVLVLLGVLLYLGRNRLARAAKILFGKE